jgi:group I intron endonuclease
MTGKSHSDETRVKISASMTGKSHSDETRAQISKSQQLVDRSGENNPMYGKVPTHAMTIDVYSIDGTLINSFSSQVACAKWLDVSETMVRKYVKSGKVFRKQYLIVRSSSP